MSLFDYLKLFEGKCDWVACLKPPIPPARTNLQVTDWFGDPIQFGDQIKYVCERGLYFEDDFHQTELAYTCQDGSNPDYKDKRGFFDVPETDEEWPRCVVGPICPAPPDAPDEGVKEYIPIAIPQETAKSCCMDDEDLTLKCPSFLSIYMRAVKTLFTKFHKILKISHIKQSGEKKNYILK